MKVALLTILFILLAPAWSLAQDSPAGTQAPAAELPADLVATDERIENLLQIAFEQIPNLSGLTISCKAGVVTLGGSVPSATGSDKAIELAEKVDGVLYVVNKSAEETEVEARLTPAYEKARTLLQDFIRKLPILLIALAVVVIAIILGVWLGKRRFLPKRLGLNDLTRNLLRRLLRLFVIGLGVFIALEILDATAIAGAFLGVAGVAGVALGFAFQDIVENYLAGILLSIRHPFATGDTIEVGGATGKVIRLTSRDTVLMTFDGNHLRIPNSKIMTSDLTNFSRNPLRRFTFAIGVSTEHDLLSVRRLGLETLERIDAILDDPEPQVVISELGDSTVNMTFYAWINQKESSFLKCKSEAIRLMKEAFDDNHIEMPEPIYRVMLKNTDKLEKADLSKAPVERDRRVGDTSADDDLDKQVEQARLLDEEDNLLEKDESEGASQPEK